MELNFIPLDYSTFDYKDKNYIIIIGKTENQKKICIVDEYAPNFWVVLKNKTNEKRIKQLQQKIEKIKVSNASRESKVEKTEVHDKKFLGQDR